MSLHEDEDASRRAASAAAAVGQRFVAVPIIPVVLHHSQHSIVVLHPLTIAARVLSLGPTRTAASLSRELEMARHLGANTAQR
jgi:hypothetical protein